MEYGEYGEYGENMGLNRGLLTDFSPKLSLFYGTGTWILTFQSERDNPFEIEQC